MTLTAGGLSGYVTKPLAPRAADTDSVLALQDWLVKNDFLTEAQMNSGPGIYGPATTAAVSALQQQLGVDVGSFPGYYGTRTISTIQAEIDALTPSVTPNPDQIGLLLIEQFEGFRSTAYWDKNHFRVGFGDDLYAVSNGLGGWTYDLEVTRSTITTEAAAVAELKHRLDTHYNAGIPGIERDLGTSKFLSLSPLRQGVLEDIAWNYGSFQSASLTAVLADFSKNSSYDQIANDIQALTNSQSRRATEAALFRWSPPSSGGDNTPSIAAVQSIATVQMIPTWADLGAYTVEKFTVAFDQPVTVMGLPNLSLNDGGKADYVSGSGTSALTFTYTVAAGQDTSRLAITGVVLPSGSSVTNAAGGLADWINVTGDVAGHVIVDTLRTRTAIDNGTGQTVNAGTGSDVVTLAGGNATLVFHGSNDVAFLGGSLSAVNATVDDLSQGLTVCVLNGGVDKISGLAVDPGMVIDLLGGLGGYASAAQVLSASTTDNAGGTVLPLGAGHSIDFVGVAPANLHTANFLIG